MAATVTTSGRIGFNRRKINLGQVFAGQAVGIKPADDRVWLISLMDHDLGYFADEAFAGLSPSQIRSGQKCYRCRQCPKPTLDSMAHRAEYVSPARPDP
jgi:putative transposase